MLASQKDGEVILDIRRPEVWKETGIIEGAATVTAFDQSGCLMPGFQQKFMSLVPTHVTPLVMYCRSGSRTNMLGRALMEQVGFEDVSHLTGGIIQCEEEGNKLVPLN
jgi:Rhodanese-related sulfurtransferase